MRSEQLRIVEAVERLGSFQRAAAEFELTQPAVGDAVRRLEVELGVQLFERTAKGVHLTKAGQIALRHIRTFLKTEHALHLDLDAEVARSTTSLCIGAVASQLSTAVLPALIKCRQAFPSLEAQVIQGGSFDIQRMLISGQLDIGVFGRFRHDPIEEGLTLLGHLESSRLIALVPPEHPLAGRPEVDVATFLNCPLVMLPDGYLRSQAIYRMAGDRRFKVACSANDSQSVSAMIAAGFGCSVTAESSADHDSYKNAMRISRLAFVDYPVIIDFVFAASPSVVNTDVCRLLADAILATPSELPVLVRAAQPPLPPMSPRRPEMLRRHRGQTR